MPPRSRAAGVAISRTYAHTKRIVLNTTLRPIRRGDNPLARETVSPSAHGKRRRCGLQYFTYSAADDLMIIEQEYLALARIP